MVGSQVEIFIVHLAVKKIRDNTYKTSKPQKISYLKSFNILKAADYHVLLSTVS
jgi:predicted MPP superfamily phosphohydrolase